MSWVRAGAILAAACVHAGAAAAFVFLSANQTDVSALQSGSGKDDLSIVATVTLQSEESLGLDPVTAERQDASAASLAVRQPELKQEEAKKEAAIDTEPPPPTESAPPQAPIQEKPPEKTVEKREAQPSAPSVPVAAQEEQRAMSRELEARRNQLFSLYNSEIMKTVMKHALKPARVRAGRVKVELTLAPSGELLAHRVIESSGSDLLDRTALASLERAAPFPHAPEELSKQPYTFIIPFDYAVK
ncbi:MAG: TonB family protein [Rhodomicrobium sp.]